MPMPNRNVEGDYRYAYQGQEKDAETGMEAFQLRLWDGRIGRWLTKDPMGEFFSPYLGMGNNPINKIDPTGGITEDPPTEGEFTNGQVWTDDDGSWKFNADSNVWEGLDGSGDIFGSTQQLDGVFIGSRKEWYDTYIQPNWDAYNQFQKDLWMEDFYRGMGEMRMGAVNIILASTAIIDAAELAAVGISTRIAAKSAVNTSLKSSLPAIYRQSLRFSKHAAERAATRGVTFKMAAKTIQKGEKFFDKTNGVITYILRNQTVKGHSLKVSVSLHNPGLITTVIKSSKSYNQLTKGLIKSSF